MRGDKRTRTAVSSGNASGSVCPKGWTLPSGGSNGDFRNLITITYGVPSNNDTKLRSALLGFNYTGYYNYSSGSLSNTTSDGYYWSRTVVSSESAYLLYFVSSNVNPSVANYRGYGYSLRCVAR